MSCIQTAFHTKYRVCVEFFVCLFVCFAKHNIVGRLIKKHTSIYHNVYIHSLIHTSLQYTLQISHKGFTHMNNRTHQLQVHILIYSVLFLSIKVMSIYIRARVCVCVGIFSNTGTSQNMRSLVSFTSTCPSHVNIP